MRIKYVAVFISGMSVSIFAYSFFFQQMVSAPQKMMQMPQQFACPPCDCNNGR